MLKTLFNQHIKQYLNAICFRFACKKGIDESTLFPNRKLINFTVMPFKIQYALAHKLELT